MAVDQTIAIIWKESHEILRFDRGTRSIVFRLLLVCGFGVLLGWRMGAAFGHGLPTVGLVMEIALLSALPLAPDSFAGERERHTLETLLASPVHTRDVFLGKVLAILIVGTSFAVLSTVANVAVTWVRFSGSPEFVLDPSVILAGLLLGALAATAVTGVGVLISMHVATVQEATQRYAYALVGVLFLTSFLWRSVLGSRGAQLQAWVARTSLTSQVLLAALVLSVLGAVSLSAGLWEFNRDRVLGKS